MLKPLIKRALRSCGFDLRRYAPSSSEGARLMAMLRAQQINTIFDVGANEGQFGAMLREEGFHGRIISFEPLSSAWGKLNARAHADPLWEVAPRGAIGSKDGEIELHIAGNSASSSALDMLPAHLHLTAAHESAYVGTERAPLRRLDTFVREYLREDSMVLIKVDTQGYESEVLKGAQELIDKAAGLHLELSLVPLYQGQVLYEEMIDMVKAAGFEMWAFTPGFMDPHTGRLLQADGTFFRR
jgi:FkbM family methyltransferase